MKRTITESNIDKILDRYIPKNQQRLSLYFIYRKNELIYIGKAQNTDDRISHHFHSAKGKSNKGRFGINGEEADFVRIYPAYWNGYQNQYKSDKKRCLWYLLCLKSEELHLHPFDEKLKEIEAWAIKEYKPLLNDLRPKPNIAHDELFDAFNGKGGAYIQIDFKDGFIVGYGLVKLYSTWGRVWKFIKGLF